MALTKPHTLSDGTTIRVRTLVTIVGTYFYEVPSRKRKGGSLYRLDNRMYGVFGDQGHLVPITNPDFAYASDNKKGAELALRFFVESAEACIKHAADEGIPVEQCYG